MKKKRIASEFIYISAILLLSFATNLMALANLGMSMIEVLPMSRTLI